ncbi:hypothetical protein IFM51744_01628 [Aspergillus udagawae]|nr:hypothetical protein IFM51744_01628 [Aspergillus udagawae]GFG01901.1 hypothetical protein IFM5058_00670 [Aspergillus udagawae]
MTHPRTREVSHRPLARSAKGGAPPRRADVETDTEQCVRIRRVVVTQKRQLGSLLKDCIAAKFRFDLSAGGPRPIERVFRTVPEDGGLCCWNTCVLTVLWITGKLDVGAIPTDTTGRTNWMCALAGGCWQAFEARYQGL